MVGVTITGQPFRIGHGDALAYALAVDDANPVYFRKEQPIVSPFFASRILKDVLEQILLHPDLGLNVLRMVHAEQSLRFIQPLAGGEDLIPSARIAAVRTVSAGQILDVEASIERGSERIVEGVCSMLVKGRKKGKGKKTGQGPAEEARESDLVATFSIAPGQPKRYAAASRDYNPIHTVPVVARLAGFKRPIAHGLCVMAMAGTRLVSHFAGGDPTRLESIKVRFARPVYPGEQLSIKVAPGTDPLRFVVLNEKGIPVLSAGQATFR